MESTRIVADAGLLALNSATVTRRMRLHVSSTAPAPATPMVIAAITSTVRALCSHTSRTAFLHGVLSMRSVRRPRVAHHAPVGEFNAAVRQCAGAIVVRGHHHRLSLANEFAQE